jgi:hypothetical protein
MKIKENICKEDMKSYAICRRKRQRKRRAAAMKRNETKQEGKTSTMTHVIHPFDSYHQGSESGRLFLAGS